MCGAAAGVADRAGNLAASPRRYPLTALSDNAIVFRGRAPTDDTGAGSVNRELATLRRSLRLAHDWKELSRVLRICLLRGERIRESVLSPAQEPLNFAACPARLADAALLLLDNGMRLGEP